MPPRPRTLAAIALTAAASMAAVPAAAGPATPATAPLPVGAPLVLTLTLPQSLTFGVASAEDPTTTPDGAARERAPAGARRAGGPRARTGLARLAADLPFRIDGTEASLAPAGTWSVRVGRGASASQGVGRADLSATAPVTSAALGAAGGDVAFDADGGPRVGEVFRHPDGLGHRYRARVDLELPGVAGTALATSVAPDGGMDAALRHRGRWFGLTADARLAAFSQQADAGRSLRLGASTALRAPASGINLTLAASGGTVADDDRLPATLYAKLARGRARDDGTTTAWSLDGAVARDGAGEGDRAWLIGATVLKRFDRSGRAHVRYRYQALDGPGARGGRAHAVMIGLKLEL